MIQILKQELPVITITLSYGISLNITLYFFPLFPLPPTALLTAEDGSVSPNPAFATWSATDQKVKSVVLLTLTEESITEVLDCTTARSVWISLEAAFGLSSPSRIYQL
ncbi:hypothetical protein ACS0TY_019837 [Phlomoides rotata]